MTEDELIHYYHLGLDFVARIGLLSQQDAYELEQRYLHESMKNLETEDKEMLKKLAEICEIWKNSY